MTTARSSQINLDATPHYHVVSRCVRRAFLCGEDSATGKNYDHRKLWLIERIKLLAAIFGIDICSYAILSNHFHLVLRAVAESVDQWDDREVIRRVRMLCPGTVRNIEKWAEEEQQKALTTWRERLTSISWFMAKLNEYIARRANKEDECSGRFWEGRFSCQALLDEGALLACMSYVDLNPVRAGIAQGLEDSSWASIRQRIEEMKESATNEESVTEKGAELASGNNDRGESPKKEELAAENAAVPPAPPPAPGLDSCPDLVPFEGDDLSGETCPEQGSTEPLPVTRAQYLDLLYWTGRTIRDDKKGHITCGPSPELAGLLQQYGLNPSSWVESVETFDSFGVFVGHPEKLDEQAKQLGQKRLKGKRQANRTYALAA